MSLKVIPDAPNVWRLLNGIVCVYKPAGESCGRVRKSFLGKLSRELCELENRLPGEYISPEKDESRLVPLQTFDNFADNPLVRGPKYEERDFRCNWSTYLGRDIAGVLVLGLNGGTKDVYKLHNLHPMRVFHIKGTFGYMTDNLYKNGKILDKSSFKHIKEGAMESLLSAIQASHQRNMYELCGVDIQSQAAYDLAAKGLIRPESNEVPLIYGAKCIDFNLPDFIIEIHCINEYESYLKALIHNIGTRLKSYATCTGLQCVRHSYFSLDQALLKKHWTLQFVIENIYSNKKIIAGKGKIQSGLLKSVNAE